MESLIRYVLINLLYMVDYTILCYSVYFPPKLGTLKYGCPRDTYFPLCITSPSWLYKPMFHLILRKKDSLDHTNYSSVPFCSVWCIVRETNPGRPPLWQASILPLNQRTWTTEPLYLCIQWQCQCTGWFFSICFRDKAIVGIFLEFWKILTYPATNSQSLLWTPWTASAILKGLN